VPNRTFMVRQVRLAASLQSGLPVGAAFHVMAGSNQIAREPRRLSALLQAGQSRSCGSGCRSAHAPQPLRWIHRMNPFNQCVQRSLADPLNVRTSAAGRNRKVALFPRRLCTEGKNRG
jgi:hypothetical protein